MKFVNLEIVPRTVVHNPSGVKPGLYFLEQPLGENPRFVLIELHPVAIEGRGQGRRYTEITTDGEIVSRIDCYAEHGRHFFEVYATCNRGHTWERTL